MRRMSPEDVFEYLDERWKCMFQCAAGEWVITEESPPLNKYGWVLGESAKWLPIAIDYDGPWEESLMERPREKVGYIPMPATNEILLYGINPDNNREDSNPKAPPEVAEWFRKVMEEQSK